MVSKKNKDLQEKIKKFHDEIIDRFNKDSPGDIVFPDKESFKLVIDTFIEQREKIVRKIGCAYFFDYNLDSKLMKDILYEETKKILTKVNKVLKKEQQALIKFPRLKKNWKDKTILANLIMHRILTMTEKHALIEISDDE